MKGSKPKMMPKGKMTTKKWEGSPMDKKMDAKGMKAFNSKRKKK
jgi:hypothetical protein